MPKIIKWQNLEKKTVGSDNKEAKDISLKDCYPKPLIEQ